MTPSRSSRPRRSATAGEDSPTRRPSSARLRRASACSSPSRRRFVASRRAPSVESPFCLRFEAMAAMLLAISHGPSASGRPTYPGMATETVRAATAVDRAPAVDRVPPHACFVGSAIFHYLGPAFAVLLFARVDALGVAWLRIAAAALVFAAWRRPWRALAGAPRALLAWGGVLAVMNCCFYLAIDRL